MKLEVRFEDVTLFDEKLCAVRITEQSKMGFEKFVASNGWTVESQASPTIYDEEKLIFLRGWDKNRDNDIMLTRHQAEVKQAIREFAEHVREMKREERELPFEVWFEPGNIYNNRELVCRTKTRSFAETAIASRASIYKHEYTIIDIRESENVIRNF